MARVLSQLPGDGRWRRTLASSFASCASARAKSRRSAGLGQVCAEGAGDPASAASTPRQARIDQRLVTADASDWLPGVSACATRTSAISKTTGKKIGARRRCRSLVDALTRGRWAAGPPVVNDDRVFRGLGLSPSAVPFQRHKNGVPADILATSQRAHYTVRVQKSRSASRRTANHQAGRRTLGRASRAVRTSARIARTEPVAA
jgi:hypothetical protein